MSHFRLFFTFWAFFLALAFTLAYAQDYKYTANGTFTSDPQSLDPFPVEFTISWNESDGKIQGKYSDNYFADDAVVAGTVSANGRIFTAVFPLVTRGVKSLTMLAGETSLGSGGLPLSITPRDSIGQPLTTANALARVEINDGSDESEVKPCSIGFGQLTGFCGLYGGTFYETRDALERCNLVPEGLIRLELGLDSQVNIFSNYRGARVGLPTHNLGAIEGVPLSTEVKLEKRNCGRLPSTTFEEDTCQVMNLEGRFSVVNDVKTFSGTYSIREEETGATCSYTIGVNLEETY